MSEVQAEVDPYQEYLRDGLSSTRSYVLLKQKSRSPVYLCFKPLVARLNASIIYMGGKLAAFTDPTHEQWEGLDDSEKINKLKEAWVKLPQDRVSSRRIGSHAGVYLIGSYGDGALVLKKFDVLQLVDKLLGSIEDAMEVEITHRDEVKGYLSGYYHSHLPEYFSNNYSSTGISPRLIGKASQCFVGQDYLYSGHQTLVEFMQVHHLEAVAPEDAKDDEEDDKAQADEE